MPFVIFAENCDITGFVEKCLLLVCAYFLSKPFIFFSGFKKFNTWFFFFFLLLDFVKRFILYGEMFCGPACYEKADIQLFAVIWEENKAIKIVSVA